MVKLMTDKGTILLSSKDESMKLQKCDYFLYAYHMEEDLGSVPTKVTKKGDFNLVSTGTHLHLL